MGWDGIICESISRMSAETEVPRSAARSFKTCQNSFSIVMDVECPEITTDFLIILVRKKSQLLSVEYQRKKSHNPES